MVNKTTYCVPDKYCARWVGKVGNDGTYIFGCIRNYGDAAKYEFYQSPKYFLFFNSEIEARDFILNKSPYDKDFEVIKSERVQISPYENICHIIVENGKI